MARIVLNEEPTCTNECPFSGFKNCQISGVPCKAIRKTPDEHGRMVDTIAFDINRRGWHILIDFERCPFCTTFEKEHLKILKEGEM